MKLKKYFSLNLFTGSVAVLVSGTVIAQAIPFLLSPLLTRLYTPHAFGLLGLFMTLLNPLSTLATGRFEQAIVLPESKEEASLLVNLILICSIVFSSLCFVLILFLGIEICEWLNAPDFISWLIWIPLSLVFVAFQQVYTFWFIREQQFKLTSFNKVLQTSTNSITAFVFGFYGFLSGLLAGELVGRFIGAFTGAFQMFRQGFSFRIPSRKELIAIATRYIHFPKYSVIPFTLSTFCASIPLILIMRWYDNDSAGYFNLSRQAIYVPLTLVGAALSQVLLHRFRTYFNERKRLIPLVKNISFFLFLVCIAIVLIIELAGPQLFGFVFGKQWTRSGEFTQLLVFTFCIQFFVTPFSVLFVALEKIKEYSYWQVVYFLAMMSLFMLPTVSILKFILIYTALEVVLYSINLYMLYSIVKKYDETIS